MRRLIKPAPNWTGVHVTVNAECALTSSMPNLSAPYLARATNDSASIMNSRSASVRNRTMIFQHGHRHVAGIAIEDRKLERMNEVGVALGVITQLAQFAFRHRDLNHPGFARTTAHREPRGLAIRDKRKYLLRGGGRTRGLPSQAKRRALPSRARPAVLCRPGPASTTWSRPSRLPSRASCSDTRSRSRY